MLNKVLYPIFILTLLALVFYDEQRFAANIVINNLFIFGTVYAGVIFFLIQDSLKSRISEKLQVFVEAFFQIRWFIMLYFLITLYVSIKYIDVFAYSYFNDFTVGYFEKTFFISRQFIYLVLVVGALYYARYKQTIDTLFNSIFTLVISFGFIIFSYDILAFVQDISIQNFWQSTIWTFYLFINMLTFFIAFVLITNMFKKDKDIHFKRNMATFLFGLNIFWSYLFVSQILIIWYGNMSLEALALNIRFNQPWLLYQQLVVILHLIIPMMFLFTKKSKTSTNNILIASYSTIMAVVLDTLCYMLPLYSKAGIAIYEYIFFILSFVIMMIFYINALNKTKQRKQLPLNEDL